MDEFKHCMDLEPFHSSTATDSSSVTSTFRGHHGDTEFELVEDYNIAQLWSQSDQISFGFSRDCSLRHDFSAIVNTKQSQVSHYRALDLQPHREFEKAICTGRNSVNQANMCCLGNNTASGKGGSAGITDSPRYSNVQIQLRDDTGSLEKIKFGDFNGNEINFHAQSIESNPDEHVIEILSPKPLDQLVAEFNFSSLEELDHVEITLELDETVDRGACGEIVWIDNNRNNTHKILEISKMCDGGDIIIGEDEYRIELIHNTAQGDEDVSITKIGFPTSTSIELRTEDLSECKEFSIDSSRDFNVPDEARRNPFIRCTNLPNVNSERFNAGASIESAPQHDVIWNESTRRNNASLTPHKHIEDILRPVYSEAMWNCEAPYDHHISNSQQRSPQNECSPRITDTFASYPSHGPGAKYYDNGFKHSPANYCDSNESFNFNLDQIYEHICVPSHDPCQYCQALKESGLSFDDEPLDFDTVPLIIDDLFIKECIENDDSCPYCEILWYNDLFNEMHFSDSDVGSSARQDSERNSIYDDCSMPGSGLTLSDIVDFDDLSSIATDESSPVSIDMDEYCYSDRDSETDGASFSGVVGNDREPNHEDAFIFVHDVNYDYEYEELGAEVVMNEVQEEGKSFLKVFNGKFAGVYEKVPNLQGADGAILIVGYDCNEPVYYVDETLASMQQSTVTERLFLLEMHSGSDKYRYGVVRSDGRKLEIEPKGMKTQRGAAKPEICCINLQELQQLTAEPRPDYPHFDTQMFPDEAEAIHNEGSVPPLHIDDDDGCTW